MAIEDDNRSESEFMDIDPERRITLVSSDHQKYTLLAVHCRYVHFVMNYLNDNDDPDLSLDVPNVNGEPLGFVVEFLKLYHENPFPEIEIPLQGNTLEETIPQECYHKWLDKMAGTMKYKVLHAAQFMDISPLLDLLCLWTTHTISGKSADEVSATSGGGINRAYFSLAPFVLSSVHDNLPDSYDTRFTGSIAAGRGTGSSGPSLDLRRHIIVPLPLCVGQENKLSLEKLENLVRCSSIASTCSSLAERKDPFHPSLSAPCRNEQCGKGTAVFSMWKV